MKSILTFIEYYLPGDKSGGPVRTISNLVKALNKEYQFKIITKDRDQFATIPYKNIKIDQWNESDNSLIFYKSPNFKFKELINSTVFDLYYLNGFLNFNFSIKLILLYQLKLIPQKPLILTPRGDLSPGALSIKSVKKKLFLTLVKFLKLYKNVSWQAASQLESSHIKEIFGPNINVKIALDIPSFVLTNFIKAHKKQKNNLKILFFSSIAPVKNLYFILEILAHVKNDFSFDIYGLVKDKKYWLKCKSLINQQLSSKISYKGFISHDKIHEIYPNYDLFFLPTLSESFSHVIYESLYFGCPVLSSGNTIWNKLEEFNAGWNFNLSEPERFIQKIEELIKYDEFEYQRFIDGCAKYIDYLDLNKIIESNRKLFE